jgi:hypothetical protein
MPLTLFQVSRNAPHCIATRMPPLFIFYSNLYAATRAETTVTPQLDAENKQQSGELSEEQLKKVAEVPNELS